MGELKKDYRISEGGLKATEWHDVGYAENDQGVEFKNGQLLYDYNMLDITIVWSDSITNAYKGEYHAKDLTSETLAAIYKNVVGDE